MYCGVGCKLSSIESKVHVAVKDYSVIEKVMCVVILYWL